MKNIKRVSDWKSISKFQTSTKRGVEDDLHNIRKSKMVSPRTVGHGWRALSLSVLVLHVLQCV